MPEYETENRGVLFPNRYKEDGDNKPDYTGNVDVQGEQWRLAAWENTSAKGNRYLSIAVSEPKDKESDDTEVPF
jgi:uncharacterized protein (DUF736 family)